MRTRRTAATVVVAACSGAAVLVGTSTSYAVRTGTALLAVWMLLRLGAAAGDRSRTWLAAALGMGILSGVAAGVHLLVTGEPSPPGGLADWLYLSYAPLAVAGLLQLPRHAKDGPWRWHALADATVTVTALVWFLTSFLDDFADPARSGTASAAAYSYPVVAVFVLAVVLAVLPRVQAELRPFLGTIALGFAFMALGDGGYALGVLQGWYSPDTWPAAATQAGLFVVAVAPLRGRHAVALVAQRPSVPSVLESSAPYLTLVPGMVATFVEAVRGESMSAPQMGAAVLLGAAIIVRQLLSNGEQRVAMLKLQASEQEAVENAQRDPLTQLGNRRALHAELDLLLAEDDVRPVVLALLDLDDFKDINDTHGHDTGDTVLLEVARRLLLAAPPDALVARLGGDEFAVCVRTTAATQDLADALLAAFDDAVVIGPRAFQVTASIGVVHADTGTATALSHVDVAMYQAKACKDPQRSGVVVLSGPARDRAAARVQLRDDVSRPVLEQFRVVYEPVVDLSDGRVVGAEALLRWDHPVLGPVGPAEFIGLAEQVGAIHELGELVLRTAVADLAGWLAEADAAGTPADRASVGVNLSPRQLGNPGLCELVRTVLAEHGLPPHRLYLEITEQALLDDWSTAVDVVRDLRALGVSVAVDDFGTGYSSLRYLRRFDTDAVKVDLEFVQALADEPRTRALVASVLDMARSLQLRAVAEGVETLDQLHVLRLLGCPLAQGYLFDRPMDGTAFGALLVAGHRYPLSQVPAQRDEPSEPLPVIRRQTG